MLTAGELRQLTTAAKALGLPDYVGDFADANGTADGSGGDRQHRCDAGSCHSGTATGPTVRALPHTWALPVTLP